jgi:hypothetical protein
VVDSQRREATPSRLDTLPPELLALLSKRVLDSVPVSESFREEFFSAARAAREKLSDKFVKRALLDQVLKMLADHRAEHAPRR